MARISGKGFDRLPLGPPFLLQGVAMELLHLPFDGARGVATPKKHPGFRGCGDCGLPRLVVQTSIR